MSQRSLGQRIRRVFLWSMVVSFCLAAVAGILVLLGVSSGETGLRVLLTTVTVGVVSLAMLCCGAVFTRPSRLLGIFGVLVCGLTLGWSLFLIWSEWTWDFEGLRVLLSGITLTIACSFTSLVVASTRHRDLVVNVTLVASLVFSGLGALLTLSWIWGFLVETWDGESFFRVYGVVLILAVLSGVVTPLISSLRKRRNTASDGISGGPFDTVPVQSFHMVPTDASGPRSDLTMESYTGFGPSSVGGSSVDPALISALEREAERRGVSVAQLVDPILRGYA